MIFFGNLYLMKLLQVCNEIPAPETYLNVCVKALDKCAPKKSKYVRANNCPIRIKKIPKNQQKNFCVSLIRQRKLEYFNKVNQENIADKKLFQNKIKILFLDK